MKYKLNHARLRRTGRTGGRRPGRQLRARGQRAARHAVGGVAAHRALEERVGCALVVRGQPCRATDTGRRLCQHVDRVRLLEQELQGALPALAPLKVSPAWLAHRRQCRQPGHLVRAGSRGLRGDAPVLVELAVDDQDHTGEWLRSGAVLAAVTGTARPAAGCNSRPLGAMRYLAAASPAFMARHFAGGVGAGSLAQAPSLVFNAKDDLQARWVRRLCHRDVELPRHTLPSPMPSSPRPWPAWAGACSPQALIAAQLQDGSLVELVPGTRWTCRCTGSMHAPRHRCSTA
jgi:LysR family transcriptional regulator (chromosome initiation inhibitor)